MSSATQKKKMNGSKWIRPEKRQRIYQRDNHSCVYCGSSIYDTADLILTLDHVVARELGGGNEHTNLVTACLSCNSSKRDLTVRAFIQHLADQGENSADIARRVRNATRRKLPRRNP
jgi:5-methylcytosine-specific restriction endonuclease McrA